MTNHSIVRSAASTCREGRCETTVLESRGYCHRHGGEARHHAEKSRGREAREANEASARRARNKLLDHSGHVRPNQGLARLAQEDNARRIRVEAATRREEAERSARRQELAAFFAAVANVVGAAHRLRVVSLKEAA